VSDRKVRVGQQWMKKRNNYHVVKVTYAKHDDSVFGGYVKILMPWSKYGEGGRSMDVFLKQYELVNPYINQQ